MARWLVTGGAGFIGSSIVERLVQQGEKVRVLDNFFTGKKEYLAPVLKKIDLIQGDICDKKDARKATKNVDYVLHQAGLRSVPVSVKMPMEYSEVNINGTLNCLMAAQENKVKRFVFASSSSVYGNSTKFPQEETDLPETISPYAVTKVTGEYYCHVFKETYGLSTVSLRYFNVFGPRQDPKSKYAAVVPKFIIEAIRGLPLEIHWDGKQSRDFTYISDVIQANILAAKTPQLKHEIYNVARGSSTSLLEIAAIIEQLVGRKLEKKFFPRRSGDIRKTKASVKNITRDLKFKPDISLKDAVQKTYAFFAENDRWKDYI